MRSKLSDNSGHYLLSVQLNLKRQIDFDQFPFSLPVVRNMKILKFHPKVTYFVGENGTGKSTFLEAIAVAAGFNAEGGSKNFNFETRRTHAILDEYILLARGADREPTDSFCGLRASITSPARSTIWEPRRSMEASPSMSSRTANRS